MLQKRHLADHNVFVGAFQFIMCYWDSNIILKVAYLNVIFSIYRKYCMNTLQCTLQIGCITPQLLIFIINTIESFDITLGVGATRAILRNRNQTLLVALQMPIRTVHQDRDEMGTTLPNLFPWRKWLWLSMWNYKCTFAIKLKCAFLFG